MIGDKLLKIKKWIPLNEAAERLSSIVEDEITVLDLLELGLSNELVLSVRLPYGEKFFGRDMESKDTPIIEHLATMFLFSKSFDKKTDISITREEALKKYSDEFQEYIMKDFEEVKKRLKNYKDKESLTFDTYIKNSVFSDYEYVSDVYYLDKVIYDLPMIGAEVIDVEEVYSLNKGYKCNQLINLNGPFLKDTDSRIINLMERFNDEHDKKNGPGFLGNNNFFPCDRLPHNSEIGMRPENLIAFERDVSGYGGGKNEDHLLLIGSMLNALKNATNKQRRWTQDALKDEIVETCTHFTKRILDDHFAVANKEFKNKSIKII